MRAAGAVRRGASCRRTGIVSAVSPSKKWSPSPLPVTIAARGAELDEPLRLRGRVARADERRRLVGIRRHDRRQRKQARDERVDRVVLEQLRARARDHHRIDDERHGVRVEEVGNGLDQPRGEEHPGLRRVDADVVEDGVELRGDELRRQLVDRRHAGRVLRRQRDDRATCRDSPPPRTPSGRPGCRRRRPSRTRRSSMRVERLDSLRRH